MIASMSSSLRRSADWITTPDVRAAVLPVAGRTSRHRASVLSVVVWSSMSIRTKAPISTALATMPPMVSRARPGSIARPIWVGLSETLRSRPLAARASSTAR